MTVVTKTSPIGTETNKIIPVTLTEDAPSSSSITTTAAAMPSTSTAAALVDSSSVTDHVSEQQSLSSAVATTSDLDSGTVGSMSDNPSKDTCPNASVQEASNPSVDSGGVTAVSHAAVAEGDDDLFQPSFPHTELARLDEMINRPRWVVPVLHNGELEILLDAVIDLCRKGLDIKSEACQRFFREGLTISFTKILTDEAVSGWKFEIQKCILKNSEKLVEVCVLKLDQDWFPLLELLAILFNPNSRFHLFNATRTAERLPLQPSDEVYAKPLLDQRTQRGWLVDLINLFGSLDGFKILLDRFNKNLSIPVIAALIRPFGLCAEVLTVTTLQKYFVPIINLVMQYLENLTDEELKKESKADAKNDTLSNVINALKCLVVRLPNQEEKVKSLEMFRLQVIFRLLQISSFNGKMNALNEINKLITSTSYSINKHAPVDFDDWLTPEKIAEWIESNNVLSIVLRDSLHQPQYVEKLEKIVRFMIKEKALSMKDLDMIWEAQTGKHEAIVKNVHDLLAKLAWDFTPQQLDHLFECFQGSWVHASKKQREKLLELIRRLAEDDKEGIMAHKVLSLLWSLAQSEDVSTDIMDQALAAHIKILDYSCSQVSSQDRDTQKMTWVAKFVEELKKDRMVLPALKQIREICQLFSEAPHNYSHLQRPMQTNYRNKVINYLHTQFTIVMLVSDSLDSYMEKARVYAKEHPDEDPNNIFPDGRFNHNQQVSERLRFLRFLLKDGHLWLCKPQANQIWLTLAENAIYPMDRENCFKWYSKMLYGSTADRAGVDPFSKPINKLMGDEPDLDPEITNEFFQQYILKFDPALLTESGMICFERFFRHVNCKEGKFSQKRRGGYVLEDLDLIGVEYLWRVVSFSPDEVAEKGILLLKDVYTNLGVRLQAKQVEIHEDFLQDCMNRLQAMYDTVCALQKNSTAPPSTPGEGCVAAEADDCSAQIQIEANRMIRILTVLKVYIAECDEAYSEERAILPLHRACRGKQVSLLIRFSNQGRQVEDVEIWSHTNETIGVVRRQLINRMKVTNFKVELYLNGEVIDTCNDRKLISQLGIQDKMQLTAKFIQAGMHNPSSPDSSSGSSTGSLPNVYDGPNAEAENCLPGVLLANKLMYTSFLFNLADLGCQLDIAMLRECARDILKLMPADSQAVEKLRKVCTENVDHNPSEKPVNISPNLEAVFFGQSSSQALYNLDIVHSLLIPAYSPNSEETWEFQQNFILSGGVPLCLKIISSDSFLPNADSCTKRSAYLTCLKIAKLLLPAVGYGYVQMVAEAMQNDSTTQVAVTTTTHAHAVLLQKALQNVPNPNESIMRSVAAKLGQFLSFRITGVLPDHTTIKALQKIAWTAVGDLARSKVIITSPADTVVKSYESCLGGNVDAEAELSEQDQDDINLSKEALEVLTICLMLCSDSTELVCKEKAWQTFIVNLLLICKNRAIRMCASEQFYLMATCCSGGYKLLLYFITLLFTLLSDTPKDPSTQSPEYFHLLCRLLAFACNSQIPLKQVDALLNQEIAWLKKIRGAVLKNGSLGMDESLLEGHLSIIRELILFQSSQKKQFIGSDLAGHNLIKELVEDFLFTASKVMLQYEKNQGDSQLLDQTTPICTSPNTTQAAFELLISLITACLPNLKCLADMLTAMFYSGSEMPLTEWEYIPPIGPKPHNGFVGLKNAGATCYMNSVIQQLFMIEPIREYILSAEGAVDEQMDVDDMDDKSEFEVMIQTQLEGPTVEDTTANTTTTTTNMSSSSSTTLNKEFDGTTNKLSVRACERKEYNLKVLKYVQYIFAHLACSKMQYYVPKGFWKHFRLQGEPVNLREQHDALEFFNSLVDSLDEALKALGYTPILTKILGGSFADQKICRDCPHRYSREEPFTVLNIDIRNQQNLLESLEQYVKGDLLEGANAYHCDKCNKKVDTVKRLCIKKLPPTLAIQLKRFDYDWERECAIKFNDYFEFPRQLDMMPYTVQGLAKAEGEYILDENEEKKDDESERECTKYNLVGVVVHSGQASGGHYFSYILHRSNNQPPRWYKFDDGEVTEFKMDDDEEMKNHCFGGEYMGEVFDHMLKRMQYRRQKRWWNAYILFYEKMTPSTMANFEHNSSVFNQEKVIKQLQELTTADKSVKMPLPIEQCVRRQNIRFLHNRNQFSPEYFRFMRRILVCNAYHIQPTPGEDHLSAEIEELAMCSVQLVSKFLFNIGFHTKKTLRGPANDWHDALVMYFRYSKNVRNWFIQNILFNRPSRFSEFLLESPNTEIRSVFMRILVYLAHFSHLDGPCPPSMTPVFRSSDQIMTVSDHILTVILSLLKKEVSEHSRHLPQYFHFFINYSNLGAVEKQQLLNLNVPELFMVVVMEDNGLPPAKYQCTELSKLYSVVSQLIRCCDVSDHCSSSTNKPLLPNPHKEPSLKQPIMKVQPAVSDMLYGSVSFVKKLMQDCNNYDETTKLLKFCCWENPMFSWTVLSELLLQVSYSYTYELRPYLDLLLQMLLLEDSWQSHRIHNALKGIADERDGLFDTIQVSKNQHHKRAYQCIKMIVQLLTRCQTAEELLMSNPDLRRRWTSAVEWLQDELDRRPYSSSAQYQYGWSNTQVQSNETSNGYFLERSNSARMTLSKALEYCPDDEQEESVLVVDDPEAPQFNGGNDPAAITAVDKPPQPTSVLQQQQPTQQIQQLKQQLQQVVPAGSAFVDKDVTTPMSSTTTLTTTTTSSATTSPTVTSSSVDIVSPELLVKQQPGSP